MSIQNENSLWGTKHIAQNAEWLAVGENKIKLREENGNFMKFIDLCGMATLS